MPQNRTTKRCLKCGVERPLSDFQRRTKPDGSANGLARVCIPCLDQSHVSLGERFWSKVDRSAGDDACWPWTAGQDGAGYGAFRISPNKVERSNRVAWMLTNGPIPRGIFVCHACDNPICCNPSHLFLGTSADNNRDRHAKGRSVIPQGERHGMAILTEREVKAIRAMYAAGGWTYRSLGEHFGVSESTVMFIVRRRHWKHVA